MDGVGSWVLTESGSPERSVCAGGQSSPPRVLSPLPQGLWPLVGRRSGDLWGNGKTDSLAGANAQTRGRRAPGLGSCRHLAPPTLGLAPPAATSPLPLSLLPRSPPPPDSHGAAKFLCSGPRTGRGLGASRVPVAPSSRTDPGPAPAPLGPCCAAAGEGAVALPRNRGWPPRSQRPSRSRPRPRHRTAAPRGLGCGH